MRPNDECKPERLHPDSQIGIREISEFLGERGHAYIWALNHKARKGQLPSASEIIIGLARDLDLDISHTTAARALRDIRRQEQESVHGRLGAAGGRLGRALERLSGPLMTNFLMAGLDLLQDGRLNCFGIF